MSVVGPRPNVRRETDLYTADERRLLSVQPGVTDLASIVFSDYSEILRGSADPDIEYNQRIRPWKSRLGLLYVDGARTLRTDMRILGATALALMSRRRALRSAERLVGELGGDETIRRISKRTEPLPKGAPPGSSHIVTSRNPTAQR